MFLMENHPRWILSMDMWFTDLASPTAVSDILK